MRVLLYTPFYDGNPVNAGGIAIWAKNLKDYYDNLKEKSVDLEILSSCRDRYVPVESSFFFRIYSGIIDYSRKLRDLKKHLNNNQYDIVHSCTSASFGLFKDWLSIRIIHKHKAKAIIHFRFGRIPELAKSNNWEWKILIRVVKNADEVIVIDRNSFDTLRSAGFENISYVPNPLQPATAEYIKTAPEEERVKNKILFVGHVIESKGVRELIKAAKQMGNVQVTMAGFVEEDYKKVLLDLAGPDSERWLSIIGHVQYQESLKLMLSCDVFVLPTYTEGFPNVILEAMACGCPIVTTNVGAIPEMLEPENNKQYGIMVRPGDVEGLRESIVKMLDDSTFKQECGKNAQIRVNERYNINAVWNQLVDTWLETSIKE